MDYVQPEDVGGGRVDRYGSGLCSTGGCGGRVDRYYSGLCSTGGCGGGWIDTVVDYVQQDGVGEGG